MPQIAWLLKSGTALNKTLHMTWLIKLGNAVKLRHKPYANMLSARDLQSSWCPQDEHKLFSSEVCTKYARKLELKAKLILLFVSIYKGIL